MIYNTLKKTFNCLTKKQIVLLFSAYLLTFISKLFDLIGLFTFLPFFSKLYGANNISILQNLNLDFLNALLINKPAFFYLKLILIIFLIKHVLLILSTYLILKIEKKIFLDVSSGVLKIFSSYPIKIFYQFSQGALLRNIFTETKNFVRLSSVAVGIIFESILLLLLICIFIYNQNQGIILSIGIIIFILIIFWKLFKNKLKIIGEERTSIQKKLNNHFLSIVNLHKENFLFRKKNFFNQKFLLFLGHFKSNTNLRTFINSFPRSIFEILVIIILMFFFKSKMQNFASPKLIFEELLFMGIILYRLFPTYTTIQKNFNDIIYLKRCLDVIYKHLYQSKKIILNKEFELFEDNTSYRKIHEIKLKNVKINYKNKSIKIPDFRINKGEIILIVGKSGSGKTSLAHLISGLIVPSQGKVIINNKFLLKNYTLMRKFGSIGYVSQDTYLIDGTIKDNIIFGSSKKFDQKSFNSALKISQCISFMDRKINLLSGGEKQRVGLARAIYNSDDIIIFDEPTSNLDNNTSKNFVLQLNKIKKNKLIIFISHKKEIYLKFDKLIDIDKHNKR